MSQLRKNRMVQSLSSVTVDDILSSRQRQIKKDEAIRKKIEQELSKKKSSTRVRQTRRVAGTVSALRPLQALTMKENTLVIEAAQLMAAKRSDCVLVVDDQEQLCGIFTAKDLAYRVVACSLDARTTHVSKIMTRRPVCVTADTSAQDALNLMVSRGLRHLPVCNEEGDIFGLLDITKCLYEALKKMERAFGSSRRLYDALEGVEREWANSPVQFARYMESLRAKMLCPDLTTVLDGEEAVQVAIKTPVRDIAKLMKQYNTTAVLVMDHSALAGIFTSKDIVLRVIAAGLAPETCSVIRVMTPHPDTASPSTSILEALKKMHDGHYLNLPVLDDQRRIVGCVDVLRLTYATLEQINSIEGNRAGSNHKFWESIIGSSSGSSSSSTTITRGGVGAAEPPESDSLISETSSPCTPRPGDTKRSSYLSPGDNMSTVTAAANGTRHDATEDDSAGSVWFKFSHQQKTYRFRWCESSCPSLAALRALVFQKLYPGRRQAQHESVSDCLTIAYCDDEQDEIVMTSDADLMDAIQGAQKLGQDRVRLIVHIRRNGLSDDDDSASSSSHHQRNTIFFGGLPIPQEMLLPAAITFLGVVILGVFAFGRR